MRTALALILTAAPLFASDLLVAPGDSIQDAIDAAAPGDRVLVQPGTYLGQIDFKGKAIEVIGLHGAGATTLDGAGVGPVVRFATGEGRATRLQGFTVTGGAAAFGAGGIVCSAGATPTIEDSAIVGNSGKFGGGITGSPFLRRCSIVGNHASVSHGGGIYGAPDMQYCVVAGNSSTSADGGGLYLLGGPARIDRCVIAENHAVFANSIGGGIYIDSTCNATIERTVIVANSAMGGVFAGYGGGVRAEASGSTLDRCTVVGNSVTGSSTFGAGLYGPLVVTNSIVRGNLGGPDITNATSVRYSDVGGGYAGDGNVDLLSLFVDEAGRDFHLTAQSPLIDLGDPAQLDPDGTPVDLGAFMFQTLYTRSNAEAASWLDPSWPEVSARIGGKQELLITGEVSSAGQVYLTWGSLSGTAPGFDLFGAHVPLQADTYFLFTLMNPNSALLPNSLGFLDAEARGSTTFTLPPNELATYAGLTLHHATLAGTTGASAATTNAVRVVLVP